MNEKRVKEILDEIEQIRLVLVDLEYRYDTLESWAGENKTAIETFERLRKLNRERARIKIDRLMEELKLLVTGS